MRIRFLGAARMVTGSCFLLEAGAVRIMVDCGMFQGPRFIRENNYRPFSIPPQSVDYLLLTHAHIDHSGLIPKLVKQGFRGKIFATAATVDLCSVMLPDSGYIQEMEVERLNRKNRRAGRPEVEPIYTAEDARNCLSLFQPVNYGEELPLTAKISARFLDAGHILGSSVIELSVQEGENRTRLVFSGDLGNENKPYLNDPVSLTEADYLIMESTYGDRLHDGQESRPEDRRRLLREIVWGTYRKGGNLIIPAFAVERTQDLLYDLNLLALEGDFPPMKVYIDSPLATAATEIFRRHWKTFDEETRELIARGNDPLRMPALEFTRTTEESMALNKIPGGAIIISASGMAEAGRIKHHLKHNLWRPECTVLLVGFQAPGTKGRRLRDGAGKIRIHGEEIAVRAEIRSIEGYSAHADQQALLDWVGGLRKMPRQIFLVHGEAQSAAVLAELLAQKYGAAVSVPFLGETAELTPGEVIDEAKVREALAALSARLEDVLQTRAAQDQYASLLNKINDLEGFVEKMVKRAG
ncbi:MAG: MBL fold metallo-hydrolase [Armatimonadetes bacterium]|nr:MBL fold metallo-hydrolase [Armatimonadota bacterium]